MTFERVSNGVSDIEGVNGVSDYIGGIIEEAVSIELDRRSKL